MPHKPTLRGAQAPGFYRFRIGNADAIVLHEGVLQFDNSPGFVRNADAAQVGGAFAASGLPHDKITLSFNVLAVDAGNGIVLVDAGFGEGGPPGTGRLAGNLEAAGIRPEDVGTVVVSHFHRDHIGGLIRTDGTPAFANADILVPEAEWRFWMDEAHAAAASVDAAEEFRLVRTVFEPLLRRMKRFVPGDELQPGLLAVDAAGHTPGMSAFELTSAGDTLLHVADLTNNPIIFARNPDWRILFDMDPERAVAVRKTMLERAATESRRLFFCHAPFPGLGTVVGSRNRYDFLPALWTAS